MTVRVGGALFRIDDARTSPFDMARTVLTFSQTRITNERDTRDNGYPKLQRMALVLASPSCDTEQDHTDNRYDPRKVSQATITGESLG